MGSKKNGMRQLGSAATIAAAGCTLSLGAPAATLQQPDNAAVVRQVDAAVRARFEGIGGYTVTEHYAVYRNHNESHPAAEMTVKTTYQKDRGKSYDIVSETGEGILLKFGLHPLLDNEKRINDPANREASWFTSANYEMKLKSPDPEQLDGRQCYALAIKPRRKAPNLIIGTLWVDASDFTVVRLDGTASKSPSIWSGPPHMMRDYARMDGFSEATHARAVSDSALFGETVVTIDYQNYKFQLNQAQRQ